MDICQRHLSNSTVLIVPYMFRSCAFAAPGRHGCQECHKGVPGVLFHPMFSPMFFFFSLSLSRSYVFSGCSCFELLLPGVHRLHFGEGQRHQGDLRWIAIQRLLVYSVWHSANLLGVCRAAAGGTARRELLYSAGWT